MINMVLASNTTFTKTPPRVWKDMLEPTWSGNIVMPNPHYSGAVPGTFGSLTMNYWLSFFKDLRRT